MRLLPFLIRFALVRRFSWLSLLLGKIGIPCKHRLVVQFDNDIKHSIRPGDVLLFKKRWELSNLLIPGKYKHAAIYVGESKIIEAVFPKVRLTELRDSLAHYHCGCVLRANFLTEQQQLQMASVAQVAVGTPYDLYFENSKARFYCSELVAWAILSVWRSGMPCPWQHRDWFGMLTTVPQDFYDSAKFSKVYEYDRGLR